ncbi:acetyl-CoA hydrolase/transferase family protein [Sporomusa termitida]|uniref:Butanoate coenzyme A-transferase n=1 Tax=Sporomusa termitida TaxID=2377 RepID=A0A517DQB1_9FIRM|nr:acetyl-CoA hydrolase/transferase C-terminal domain-containing protein [Sporomusa termitida]QDR79498.1 Butanoate coenzyme A-transferase [Sporomusa termitida]
MTNWREYYESRRLTAEEAVQKIKSDTRVLFAHAVGEACRITDALVANKDLYRDVEIVHFVPMGKGEYCKPENAEHFRHNAMFAGGTTRKAIEEGRADFTPIYLSEVPLLFTNGTISIDTFITQVSPPDKHGYCSFGVSVDYSMALVRSAKLVIAQVNEHMPRTMGDSFVHVSEIDHFVEYNAPIPELGRPTLTDVEIKIGENCASLINDGDTLQLGIGSLPDATLLFLKDKKDLGIHSEMISDGVMELIEAGVITNKKKNLNPGKVVVAFLMGTKKFYDFVDNNPAIQMMPADYTNDPFIIAKNDNMVSINSTVEVDFYGQLASESIGKRQISGTGGQVDFIRGANRSRGGKSIIVINSTAQNGTKSKIVPFFSEGTPVTCGRAEVEYIVTEYGIARIKGKTLSDRARDLISIAHPKFRGELIKEWEKFFHSKF